MHNTLHDLCLSFAAIQERALPVLDNWANLDADERDMHVQNIEWLVGVMAHQLSQATEDARIEALGKIGSTVNWMRSLQNKPLLAEVLSDVEEMLSTPSITVGQPSVSAAPCFALSTHTSAASVRSVLPWTSVGPDDGSRARA